MNVEQIREELTTGKAIRRFSLPDEAWYSAAIHEDRGTLWLGVDARDDAGRDDGCIGEWSVCWIDLGGRLQLVPQLQIFDDAWAAVVASDFFDVVLPFAEQSPTREQLIEALQAAGWTDTTARVETRRA